MKAQHFGDAVFKKSRTISLLPFLAPSISSIPWRVHTYPSAWYTRGGYDLPSPKKRYLTTSTNPLQASASATAKVSEIEDDGSSNEQQKEPQSSTPSSRSAEIDSLLGSILDSPKSPTKTTSKTSHFQTSSPPTIRRTGQGPSSADLIAQALKSDLRSKDPIRQRQGQLAEAMDLSFIGGGGGGGGPDGTSGFSSSPFARTGLMNEELTVSKRAAPPPVRLDAFLGRSEALDPSSGNDLARGLRKLSMNIAVNKVRQDERSQKFHERGGLKRKRLVRERWRRRFRNGFKATVAKVDNMRRKGW